MQQDAAISEIIERTGAFVRENFLYVRGDVRLNPNDRFLERGIVDSLGVVEFVAFIEDEFGIEVGDDEVTERNFGTLTNVATYVLGKRAATTGVPRSGPDITVLIIGAVQVLFGF
jgi:acyl carrier protein